MSAEPVTRRRRMPRRPNPVVPDFPPLSVPGPAWVLRGSQLTIRLLLLAASVAWVSPAASQDAPTHREPVQNRDTSAEAPEDSAAGDGQPVESKEERRKRQTREALERLNDFRALRKRFIIDTDTGEVRGYLWGNAEGFYESRGETWRVFADAILVEGLFEEVTETEETDQGSKEKKKTRGKPRSFYAEGNVRLHGREVTLGMDAFYYDHVQQRGIALRTSGRGRLPSADRLSEIFSRENLASERRRGFVGGTTMGANFPSLEEDRQRRQEATDSSGVTRALPLGDGVRRAALQMAFRAEVLRVVDVDSYEGEGIVLSSCEFGVPHFGLHSGLMSIEPVPEHDDGHDDDHDEAEDMEEESDEGAGTENTEDAEAEESEREISKHRAIDPEDTWLQFNGLSLVPFPVGYWNTEWIEYNPIRSFGFTTSSKYGNRVDVEWNLNWILKQFPGTDSGYLGEFLDDSELGVITDYMSKRGFGHGVVGEYGTRPLR
ncbi:MAG: hypothetical protein MK538_21010, partial [Planctomycetes bacterium]|nr:hypothetical protein [Planctomycetota bacterium]